MRYYILNVPKNIVLPEDLTDNRNSRDSKARKDQVDKATPGRPAFRRLVDNRSLSKQLPDDLNNETGRWIVN